MKKERFVLVAVLIYSLISGVGGMIGAILYSLSDMSYVTYMMIGLIIQALLAIWAYVCYGKIGDGSDLFSKRIDKNILWLLPHFILVFILLFDNIGSVTSFDSTQLMSLGVYFFTCILIGVSEEIMFRGAVLQHFSALSRRKMVLYSAGLFSLFHLSNILISGDLIGTIAQLISTFIFGLFAGGVVLKQKTLLPIIIYHALWDFLMQITIFSESMSTLSTVISGFSQLLNLLIALVLIISLRKVKREEGRVIYE